MDSQQKKQAPPTGGNEKDTNGGKGPRGDEGASPGRPARPANEAGSRPGRAPASGASGAKKRPPAEPPKPSVPSMTKPGQSANGSGSEPPADSSESRGGSRSQPSTGPARRSGDRPAPSGPSSNRTGSTPHSAPADEGSSNWSAGGRGGQSGGRSGGGSSGGGGGGGGGSRSRSGRPGDNRSRPGSSGPGGARGGGGGRPSRGGGAPGRRPDAEAPRASTPALDVPERSKDLVIGETITVRDMSTMMGISPIDIIKELMNNGVMANINQIIDYDTAAIIAGEMGYTVTQEKPAVEAVPETTEPPKTLRQRICDAADPEKVQLRPPVVTVLGHVDHGKTTLLDAIRHTAVVDTEAGGITQRIGAYQVDVQGRKITFLDTPGHEAFTAMRYRGAQVTDLAVLVVAADDGVMPQTREAINHARAAQVPILVAINKIDKPNANPDLLKQQLADIGLVPEDWGGDVICVPVSAKLRRGIDDLLENILLVTEVAELKATFDCPAVGTVVEGRVDKNRGVLATLLVQNGTLRVGDNMVVGDMYGRVRAMFDGTGKPIDAATPSMPAAVLGLSEVPAAGQTFEVYETERQARTVAAERTEAHRATSAQPAVRSILSLEDISNQIKAGQIKELNVILKADVQGSIEPVVNSLEQLGDADLRVKILHAGTGNITESDVMLAGASNALVIGFAVEPDGAARRLAEQEGVSIQMYQVIYALVEEIDKALHGMLEPKFQEVVIAHAVVRNVFRIPKVGLVAGAYVLDGTVTRDSRVRVLRAGQKLMESTVGSLKRFQEDVKEVATNYEFGITVNNATDIKEEDTLEFYKKERVS